MNATLPLPKSEDEYKEFYNVLQVMNFQHLDKHKITHADRYNIFLDISYNNENWVDSKNNTVPFLKWKKAPLDKNDSAVWIEDTYMVASKTSSIGSIICVQQLTG